jgi:hypothetical protein
MGIVHIFRGHQLEAVPGSKIEASFVVDDEEEEEEEEEDMPLLVTSNM